MAKKTPSPSSKRSAHLSRTELAKGISKLQRRIEDLRAFDVSAVLKRFDASTSAITAKVDNTLREVLGDDTLDYDAFAISLDTLPLIMGTSGPHALAVQVNLRENVDAAITKLTTLIDIFSERMEDAEQDTVVEPPQVAIASTRRIFVVHGRDEGLRESVARYLSKLDLDPVILHEQANEGRTIIEKFEAHSEVDFAVVLFTPDDVGYPAGQSEAARNRPRQNVILELGFFIGRLGRGKVCVLHKGDMEMLSDIAGVLYVSVDNAGHWKLLLARELKKAGLEIDLNRAMD